MPGYRGAGLNPVRADKSYGQHFLKNPHLLAEIAAASGAGPNDLVYEVGPGLGHLTQALLVTGAQVISIEKDLRLIPGLEATLAGLPCQIIAGDALEYDWQTVPEGSLFVANLPYNVATPILRRVLLSGKFRLLVFLVQKEVAGRFRAGPKDPLYGLASLWFGAHGQIEVLRTIPPGAFTPPPKVDSSLVRIKPKSPPADFEQAYRIAEYGFKMRRKTLKKNLLAAGFPEEKVLAALEGLGIPAQARAEELSLAEFTLLIHALL